MKASARSLLDQYKGFITAAIDKWREKESLTATTEQLFNWITYVRSTPSHPEASDCSTVVKVYFDTDDDDPCLYIFLDERIVENFNDKKAYTDAIDGVLKHTDDGLSLIYMA